MRLAIGLLLVLGCGPRGAAVTPGNASPERPRAAEPSTTAVSKDSEPVAHHSAAEKAAAPRVVQSEEGWSRPDDPDGPTISLLSADYSPGAGAAGAAAVLDSMDALLVCWESAPRTSRVTVVLSAQGGIDGAALETLIPRDPEQAQLRHCINRILAMKVPWPEPDGYMRLRLWFAPQRADIQLRKADPSRIVAVRDAGTCWQWEDYPCAPNKRCRADEWLRTTCGEPTMRDDVRLHIGTPAQTGWTDAKDLRLLAPDGRVLWLTELSEQARTSLAGRVMGDGAPSVEARVGDGLRDVVYGASEIVVSLPEGLYALDRKTGAVNLSWQAPPPGEPKLWFDGGRYVISSRRYDCKGDAGHGAFVTRCQDRWIWLDGYTLAVFNADTHHLLGSKHLGQRGAVLRTDPGMRVVAEMLTAGLVVEVTGEIFLE